MEVKEHTRSKKQFALALKQRCAWCIPRTLGGQCAWTGVNRRVESGFYFVEKQSGEITGSRLHRACRTLEGLGCLFFEMETITGF